MNRKTSFLLILIIIAVFIGSGRFIAVDDASAYHGALEHKVSVEKLDYPPANYPEPAHDDEPVRLDNLVEDNHLNRLPVGRNFKKVSPNCDPEQFWGPIAPLECGHTWGG